MQVMNDLREFIYKIHMKLETNKNLSSYKNTNLYYSSNKFVSNFNTHLCWKNIYWIE